MKANRQSKSKGRNDIAVSPVIAVILMVAITVVLAATVYVWVSGLSGQGDAGEAASARISVRDLDGDGSDEWIILTLAKGENVPYGANVTTIVATRSAGTTIAEICETAVFTTICSNNFTGSEGDTWAVGESLYIPCQADENVFISITVRSTAILDNVRVDCDEAA